MSRKALLALRWPVTLAVVSMVLWALGRYGLSSVKGLAIMAAAMLVGIGWLLVSGGRLARKSK